MGRAVAVMGMVYEFVVNRMALLICSEKKGQSSLFATSYMVYFLFF